MKSAYKFMKESWSSSDIKERVRTWRKGRVIKRIDKPTRPDRAQRLGYKAKQGFIIVRVRIKKGGRKRPTIRKGRKPQKSGLVHFTPSQSLQAIAEKRAARNFPNMEVLNSYYVAEDGQYKYYENILVDPHHPSVKSDKNIKWITKADRRVFRGLTSAGKKSRDKRK
jgi:large subunit ribosomal protein L15e